MKERLLIAILCTLASQANARDVFGSWIAGGTSCNAYNVGVIQNGDSVSVLFNEFGVNMPQGDFGDGASVRKTCTFRIAVNPPNGFYLARFTQVYSGGIIKSANSSAQLNIRYNFGPIVGVPLPIVFRRGVTINPEDAESLFTKNYHNNMLVANCGGSTNYGINMSITAVRDNVRRDYLVGGLDSVDARFVQRLELIPEWALCR